jgi:phosphotransferase system  glucose/maltose/N-acetylglucosamine-specific IIC component
MNYLKITKYVYLIVGFIMVYDAISKWNDGTDKPWLSVMLAALAFFMFFFRTYFAKKFDDRNPNNQPKQ